jgi:EmrB/QacA subfamily drug resistance transporter
MARKWIVFCVVVFGVFVSVVDTSASVVALPTLAFAFHTDLPTVQWVTVANGLTIAALLVSMGRLGDLLGRKRVYVVGFGAFSVGSLLAAMAQSVELLIAARVIAGVGAAMAQGNSVAITAAAFEDHERGRVLGMQMGVVGVGAITGPALGGLIIGAAGWRGIFAVIAVAGLVVMLVALAVLRRRPSRPVAQALRFDWAGAGLSALFLVAFLLTLASGARVGWSSPRLLGGVVASTVLLWLFIRRQRRAPEPLLELSLFRIPVFTVGVLGTVTTFMGLAAMRYLVPFHVQGVLSLDATRTGLVLVPAAIVTAIASPITGHLSDRLGARRFANIGLVVCVFGLLALASVGPRQPLVWIILAMMLTSFGAAAFHAPNTSSVINSVPRRHYGVVSGFNNLARNAGNVIGVALATTTVSIVMASNGFAPSIAGAGADAGAGGKATALLASFDAGARISFLLLAGLVAAVALLSIRFASTMPPPGDGEAAGE